VNCQACETLLLRDQDGALSPTERTVLSGHLANCTACREFHSALVELKTAYQTEAAPVNVPDVEIEWAELQNRLPDRSEPKARKQRHIPAPVLWLSAPLAAAAALAFVFLSSKPETTVTESSQVKAVSITHVDYVESGDPNASTMVYIDQDSGWLVVWASHAGPNTNG
jgi:anti-sigma factor RsiW